MKKQQIINMLVGLGLVFTASATQAGSYEAGFIAAESGNFSKAVQEYEGSAQKGDANAQFNLGLMYHGGLGVPMNEVEAVRWYHKAAENGNRGAQEFLAAAYKEGWFGLPKNNKKADFWQKKIDNSF